MVPIYKKECCVSREKHHPLKDSLEGKLTRSCFIWNLGAPMRAAPVLTNGDSRESPDEGVLAGIF
jgi:hypothetical protein